MAHQLVGSCEGLKPCLRSSDLRPYLKNLILFLFSSIIGFVISVFLVITVRYEQAKPIF